MQDALINMKYGLTSIATINCSLKIILDLLKHFFDLQAILPSRPRSSGNAAPRT